MSTVPKTIPALRAPAPPRDNPLTRSVAGLIGMGFLAFMIVACVVTLPWTLARVAEPGAREGTGSPRYDQQYRTARHLPPSWWGVDQSETGLDTEKSRLRDTAQMMAYDRLAFAAGPTVSVEQLQAKGVVPTPAQIDQATPSFLLGTDLLGRSMLIRCLTGGGISLGIGIASAALSVFLGTLYGAFSGYMGGRIDALLMRIVDILYGLPTILLVVLLAVAVDSAVDNWQVRRSDQAAQERAAYVEQGVKALAPAVQQDAAKLAQAREDLARTAQDKIPSRELSSDELQIVQIVTLLVAIGGVSWLTMARVVRGQVLSLKAQPFMEAARAMGVGPMGLFGRHLLPNLVGTITVYATLTVPQAILQESFLSFLGIGVRAPMPSWGNLASDGLLELNLYKSHWWALVFPCLLLGLTLLALNFVGEGLREALDPKRSRR